MIFFGWPWIWVILTDFESIKVFNAEWDEQDAERSLVFEISYKDYLVSEKLLFLSALYWAEGSKKDFGLSNTDPELIKIFVEGLRKVFKIDNKRFRISIRIYEDLDSEKSLAFWSKITGVAKKDFVSVNTLRGKKNGKLQRTADIALALWESEFYSPR